MPSLPADEGYRRALVETASVPRAILLLYDRLILLLEQALAQSSVNGSHAQQLLSLASQILTHLLAVFNHSEDQAYQHLYLSHEYLAQAIHHEFRQGGTHAQGIAEILNTLKAYRHSWRQGMKIRPRKRHRPGPLNVRSQSDAPDKTSSDQQG